MSFTKIICIDFDGVIHQYKSPWTEKFLIEDGPIPGAFEWLKELIDSEDFRPVIYSSRSVGKSKNDRTGIDAMKHWFSKHGFPFEYLQRLDFPTQKPAAWLTIDDRAMCFEGFYPSLSEMERFKPWNKRVR